MSALAPTGTAWRSWCPPLFRALCSNGIFIQVKENEAGITIDTWLRNEGSKPVSGPISDRWTRFNSSGRFGSIEWADSVDPSHKAGYAYAWLPDENGKVAPRNSTLNPGDEIKIERFVAVGKSPAHALGVVAAKLGKTGRLKLSITGLTRNPYLRLRSTFASKESTVRGYPDEDGKIEIQLPVGSWKVSAWILDGKPKSFTLRSRTGKPSRKAFR